MIGLGLGVTYGQAAIPLADQVADIVAATESARIIGTDTTGWSVPGGGTAPSSTTAGGFDAISFNGTDSRLVHDSVNLSSASDWTMYLLVGSVASGSQFAFWQNSTATNYTCRIFDGSASATNANAGTPTTTAGGVVAADMNALHDAIADSGLHLVEVTAANLSAWDGLYLSGGSAALRVEGSFCEVLVANLTASERVTCRAYFAETYGVTTT